MTLVFIVTGTYGDESKRLNRTRKIKNIALKTGKYQTHLTGRVELLLVSLVSRYDAEIPISENFSEAHRWCPRRLRTQTSDRILACRFPSGFSGSLPPGQHSPTELEKSRIHHILRISPSTPPMFHLCNLSLSFCACAPCRTRVLVRREPVPLSASFTAPFSLSLQRSFILSHAALPSRVTCIEASFFLHRVGPSRSARPRHPTKNKVKMKLIQRWLSATLRLAVLHS